MTTNANTFEFRNKFQKVLTNENRTAIQNAFQKFCQATPEYTRRFLWNLTYYSDVSAILDKLNLSTDLIPAESIDLLRNELRHQYEQQHPDFLKITVPAECQDAFNAMANRISNPVATYMVHELLFSRQYLSENVVERTLALLKSEQEKCYFGGIRDLGFSYDAANYLKPFHTEIHDLLKAMYEHRLQTTVSNFENRPFADLLDRLNEAYFELAEESAIPTPDKVQKVTFSPVPASPVADQQQDMPAASTSDSTGTSLCTAPDSLKNPMAQFTSITALEVLKHLEIFSALMASDNSLLTLRKLRALGFDLNEIMDKEDKINTLLCSIKELST